MAVKNIIKAIPLTTLSAAGLGASYQAINPDGLDQSCIILRINNDSNVAITISFDGVTDHEYLGSQETLHIDAQTNSLPQPEVCVFAKGTKVYVKGTAGMGTLAVSAYYQPQS